MLIERVGPGQLAHRGANVAVVHGASRELALAR